MSAPHWQLPTDLLLVIGHRLLGAKACGEKASSTGSGADQPRERSNVRGCWSFRIRANSCCDRNLSSPSAVPNISAPSQLVFSRCAARGG